MIFVGIPISFLASHFLASEQLQRVFDGAWPAPVSHAWAAPGDSYQNDLEWWDTKRYGTQWMVLMYLHVLAK